MANRLWNATFVHVLLIELACQVGIYSINPVVSGYAVALGTTAAVGGFLAGFNGTVSLLCRPFTGFLADRFAKKRLLLMAAAMFCIGSLGISVSTNVVLIAIFRGMQGAAFAFKTAILAGFVVMSVPQDAVGRGVGWMGLTSTIANALGPALGSFLSSTFAYSVAFTISGVIFLSAVILVLTLKIDPDAGKDKSAEKPKFSFSFSSFFYMPKMVVSLMGGLCGVPYAITGAMMLLAGDMLGIEGASLYFVAFASAAFISKPLVGKMSDSFGLLQALLPAVIIELIGAIVVAFADSLPLLIVSGILLGAGQGAAHSGFQGEAVRDVPAEYLGRASNTFYLIPDLNMGLSPILAGFLLETFGVTVMYMYGVVACVLNIVILVVYCATGHGSKPKSKVAAQVEAEAANND